MHLQKKLMLNIVVVSFTFNSFENSSFASKYIAVHNDNFKVPINAKKINNSNIHGFQNGAKYIIISPREFSEQAVRLKNYRESEAQYKLSSICNLYR